MPNRVTDPRVTERRNPRTQEIDLADPLGIVDLVNAEDRTVADAVASQRERIAEAITAAEQTFRLTPGRLRHFLVTGAFCAHRAFKATVNEKEKSVTVAFDPSRWTDGDDYVPTLTVVTSSSREPRLMLPLKVESSAGKERSGP